MKLAVKIGGHDYLVTPRTGEKYIFRAVLGAIVEAGQGKALGPQALPAARAISAGLDYHAPGPPDFQVQRLE